VRITTNSQTLNLILALTLTEQFVTRNSEHSTKYSHMSFVFREIHARQCRCTVFTTVRCHCHYAFTNKIVCASFGDCRPDFAIELTCDFVSILFSAEQKQQLNVRRQLLPGVMRSPSVFHFKPRLLQLTVHSHGWPTQRTTSGHRHSPKHHQVFGWVINCLMHF